MANIVIVDKEEKWREEVQKLLEEMGHTTHITSGLRGAQDLMKREAANIDLIVMGDVPKEQHENACRWLTVMNDGFKIISLSPYYGRIITKDKTIQKEKFGNGAAFIQLVTECLDTR